MILSSAIPNVASEFKVGIIIEIRGLYIYLIFLDKNTNYESFNIVLDSVVLINSGFPI